MTSNDDTFNMYPNTRTIRDMVALLVSSGTRLGISVEEIHGDRATTFLTPDEWRTLRAEGDRLVAMIEAKAGEQS